MSSRTVTYQEVIDLVKTLPENHLQSLYDFTRFLKYQPSNPTQESDLFGESLAEIEADEAEWQAQFAASRDKLRNLAREAAAEYQAGRTEPMEFSAEGRLVR